MNGEGEMNRDGEKNIITPIITPTLSLPLEGEGIARRPLSIAPRNS